MAIYKAGGGSEKVTVDGEKVREKLNLKTTDCEIQQYNGIPFLSQSPFLKKDKKYHALQDVDAPSQSSFKLAYWEGDFSNGWTLKGKSTLGITISKLFIHQNEIYLMAAYNGMTIYKFSENGFTEVYKRTAYTISNIYWIAPFSDFIYTAVYTSSGLRTIKISADFSTTTVMETSNIKPYGGVFLEDGSYCVWDGANDVYKLQNGKFTKIFTLATSGMNQSLVLDGTNGYYTSRVNYDTVRVLDGGIVYNFVELPTTEISRARSYNAKIEIYQIKTTGCTLLNTFFTTSLIDSAYLLSLYDEGNLWRLNYLSTFSQYYQPTVILNTKGYIKY